MTSWLHEFTFWYWHVNWRRFVFDGDNPVVWLERSAKLSFNYCSVTSSPNLQQSHPSKAFPTGSLDQSTLIIPNQSYFFSPTQSSSKFPHFHPIRPNPRHFTRWWFSGLDHWLKEVAATDVVLYERWMNNEIMVRDHLQNGVSPDKLWEFILWGNYSIQMLLTFNA